MSLQKRYGVRGHDFDDVFFTEDTIESAVTLGMVQAVSNKQNTSLDALKNTMAKEAKSKGGNVISSLKYGQKGTIFSFSSTQWNALGVVNWLVGIAATDEISTEMSPSVKTGRCPMCMEEIHRDARKCKHCGEVFA